MSRYPIITAIALGAALVSLSSSSALAQQTMPGQPGGMGPTPPMAGGSGDGVAEQAPKKLGALPTTPVLPAPKESSKELRVFSLDGYFRFRGDWMKNMDLGYTDDPDQGGAPFPNPLACRTPSRAGCESSFGTANTRLRLEPMVHLDERSTVHMQIDVLDNLILGSTPAGYSANGSDGLPLGGFEDSQDAPQAGVNDLGDSITVKRVWAEIDAPLGVLKFGRMPWHWGMGIFANGGGNDPIHGDYNLDANFGDNVDRVSFSTAIPGTNLNGGVAMDWAQTGPTSLITGERGNIPRQAWDLDDSDDFDQWVFTVSRMDSPKLIADKIADGDTVFNYGAFLAYRTQDFEQRGTNLGELTDPDQYFRRNMAAYVPDFWLHMAKGKLDFEMEAVAVFGSFDAPDIGEDDAVDLQQFGGVARLTYKLMDDDLTMGFEAGFASGDQHDNVVPGRTHFSNAPGLVSGDNSMSQFFFAPDFNVDMILFEELLGTVTNAFYGKPSFRYDINSKFILRGAGIMSMAHRPVATPGNGTFYGLEFNGDLGYENDGFFAGVSYGGLLPLSAMEHPEDDGTGPGFGFGANTGDAAFAQTIQTRLVLKF